MGYKSIVLELPRAATRQWITLQRNEMTKRIKQEIPTSGNVYVYPIEFRTKQKDGRHFVEASVRWVAHEDQ